MGLVREMMFALFFGAGAHLDAFVAAFRIPNLLRDLFSEGALSNAFITVFAKTREKEGEERAYQVAHQVLTFILFFIGALTVIGIYCSPWIVQGVAGGFVGEKYQLAVLLNRILFPFILFVSFAAIYMGMLNTHGKFFLPQSASTFFNLSSIVIGLVVAYFLAPEFVNQSLSHLFHEGPRPEFSWPVIVRAITGMAWGTLFGGFVQWVVQWPQLRKFGFQWRVNFNWRESHFVQMMKLTLPAIIGGASVQINVLINTNFASFLVDGSISWLNYAFRLMQFPIGVFGVAVAIATTPEIARLLARNDREKYVRTLQESTSLVLFLCLPSALGLIFFAEAILALIYQYGQFTVLDTQQAALALRAYAAGLIFYSLIKIYQPAFIAQNDARTPMLISLGSIIVNALINWVLVFKLQFAHWGLALGTSFVALWNMVLLIYFMHKRGYGIWHGALCGQLMKMSLVAFIAVLMGYFVHLRIDTIIGHSGVVTRIVGVFSAIACVVGIYGVLCWIFKIEELQWLLRRLRRVSY